ncbi:uncharacterized protein LOC129887671 isoform X2 [Solanum dulcamara]|uniref:uncharacterized protein LOC129887671 isoform X2 n=1 Tax=Solanum dulcamara TaxID=45834 RepID=UPI0024857CCE|nr:uncharacterized protein LOC129887671 isoform X2 [Solanum dulcamara]
MSTVVELEIEDHQLVKNIQDLSIQEQTKMKSNSEERRQVDCVNNHHGVCAICLNKIVLQETALVKGCEHAYCIQDYMFEESVCLLLRASWFKPLIVEEKQEVDDDMDYHYAYEDDEELEDFHFTSSPRLHIGNRRWGDNGYVRAGRQEARPAHRPNSQDSGAGSSRQTKKKETAVPKETVGRRAKRALKREAADKAAAEKHQQHLLRLGRI